MPGQHVSGRQSVGDNGEWAAVGQQRSQVTQSGALIDQHHLAGLHQLNRETSQRFLLGSHGGGPVPEVTVVERGRQRRGPAADLTQPALPLQRIEVAVNGHDTDPEIAAEVIHADKAVGVDPGPEAVLTDPLLGRCRTKFGSCARLSLRLARANRRRAGISA